MSVSIRFSHSLISDSGLNYKVRTNVHLTSPNVADATNVLKVTVQNPKGATASMLQNGAYNLSGVYSDTVITYFEITYTKNYGSTKTIQFDVSFSGVEYWGTTLSATSTFNVPAQPYTAPAGLNSLGVTRNSDTSFSVTPVFTQSTSGPIVCAEYAVSYNATGTTPSSSGSAGTGGGATHTNSSAFSGYSPSTNAATWNYTLGNHASTWTTVANRVYKWAVRNVGPGGVSGWWYSGAYATTPAAPSNLAVNVSTGTITWTNGTSGSRNGNELEVQIDDGAWTSVSTAIGKDVTSYAYTFTADKKYAFRVRASAKYTNTLYSAYTSTVTVYSTPAAPTSVTASRSTSAPFNATVTWQDKSAYESGFYVETQENGGAWSNRVSVAAGATSWIHTGTNLASTYKYRVSAFHSNGLASAFVESNQVPMAIAAPAWVGTPTAVRCDSGGVPDGDGTCLLISANWTIAPEATLASATALWRKAGEATVGTVNLAPGTPVTVGAGAIATNAKWEVVLAVTDSFGSKIDITLTIPAAKRILHAWTDKMRMGIGKLGGKDNTLQIALPVECDGSATIAGTLTTDGQVITGYANSKVPNSTANGLLFMYGGGTGTPRHAYKRGVIITNISGTRLRYQYTDDPNYPTGSANTGYLELVVDNSNGTGRVCILGAGETATYTPTQAADVVIKSYCDGAGWTNFTFDSYWQAGQGGWDFPKWRQKGSVKEVLGGNVIRQTSAITIANAAGVALFAGPGTTSPARPIGPCINSQGLNGLMWVHYSSGIHLYNFSGASVTINIGTQLFLPSFITT